MIHGHYGLALLLHSLYRQKPKPLHHYFFATQFPDVIFAVLAFIFEIEVVHPFPPGANNPKLCPLDIIFAPYSHGLIFNIIYSVIFALVFHPVLGITVFSHFLLDFIVQLPKLDLCFPFTSCKSGLGLFQYTWLSVFLENGIVLLGAMLYVMQVHKRKRALILKQIVPVVLFMLAMTTSMPFFPPPSQINYLLGIGLLSFYTLFTFIAFYIDRSAKASGVSKKD